MAPVAAVRRSGPAPPPTDSTPAAVEAITPVAAVSEAALVNAMPAVTDETSSRSAPVQSVTLSLPRTPVKRYWSPAPPARASLPAPPSRTAGLFSPAKLTLALPPSPRTTPGPVTAAAETCSTSSCSGHVRQERVAFNLHGDDVVPARPADEQAAVDGGRVRDRPRHRGRVAPAGRPDAGDVADDRVFSKP